MDEEKLVGELQYKAVRSGGAGGQHVNKVATKVVLTFDLVNSRALAEDEKLRLLDKLGSRLNKERLLSMYSDASRSQHSNKALVTKRFLSLINKSLEIPKKRKKTRVPKDAREKRLQNKKRLAQKKAERKNPDL